LGPLVGASAGGASLVGGALLGTGADLGGLWRSATSGWVPGGLGAAGPADPLLTVLLLPTAATGSAAVAVAVLLLGGVLLSGLGAWAAAGAATRSVGVRAWAAVVWAGAPALLLALGQGRLGPVVAHAVLPWVVLGVARAAGVQRVDQVLSGLVTARAADDDGDDDVDDVDQSGVDTPVRGVPTVPTQRVAPGVGAVPEDARLVGASDPTGSITAAAAAALAFAVVVAGAPALLVPGVLALLVVALGAPRRRGRLLLVPVPALVLAGPLLAEAAARGLGGWRVLLADPGLPLAVDPADPVARLLGLPSPADALVPAPLDGGLAVAWPLLPGAVLLLLALLALLRGRPVARAVRVAWVVAALGLASATVGATLVVALDGGRPAHGWAGPGLSLAWAGLLAAAVIGVDRFRARLGAASFGWRQPVAAVLTLVAVLAPTVWLAGWAWQARAGDAVTVRALERAVVPAVGQQAQLSPLASRVLALEVAAGGDPVVGWQLLRDDGPRLDDVGATPATRSVDGDLETPLAAGRDEATAEVDALAARLASGSGGDVAGELAGLAVAAVLVPSLPEADDAGTARAARAQRDDLVGRLDSTPGLERVTQTPAGTLWRVRATAPAGAVPPVVVPSWARLVPVGADVTDPAVPAVAVESTDRAVDTTVAAADGPRTLVLAERADARWRAWLDGAPLRSVDVGWRQAFEVPADGGELVVRVDAPDRTAWLVAQGLVLLVTGLLALPVRRRRGRS
ncbi:glycosyltransferase family 2 protein, partial [Cellulomonas fimi]|nr:glycosyltransferase family 2 protein [Cellulomonas fimi]